MDEKNGAVKYDLTNAFHKHNVHMRVDAGIYVTRPVPPQPHIWARVSTGVRSFSIFGYQRKRDTRTPAYMYTVV